MGLYGTFYSKPEVNNCELYSQTEIKGTAGRERYDAEKVSGTVWHPGVHHQ